MHLVDILNLRHTVAAGVSIGITRRCPLHCAHCSTMSTMESEQAPEWMFKRFVGTFRSDDRPEILALSGGEALLRPKLVESLAKQAHSVGTKTTLLSGLYFARGDRIPLPILEAIDSVDHFSVSLDLFHEREVPRKNVFRVIGQVLDRGKDVSLHLVGTGPGDTYLEGLISEIRKRFGESVPMLVNALSHFGRARAWLPKRNSAGAGESKIDEANPCAMAAWPVVGFDGTIAACGNDDVFDRRPAHLIVGHASHDNWSTVRERMLRSNTLRAIRLYGPEATAHRLGARHCGGYCDTCMALSEEAEPGLQLAAVMEQPTTRILEEEVQSLLLEGGGARSFLLFHAIPHYAELAQLGAST